MKLYPRIQILTGITVAFISAFGIAMATPVTVSKEKGHVEFEALGRPAMLKIKGKSKGPEGKLDIVEKKLNGQLTFDLQGLETGIKLRDEHMKNKYLEVKKHPNAVLKINQLPLPSAWPSIQDSFKDVPFKALLTLHGVEKEVEGTFDAKRINDTIQVESFFQIQLKDFKIEVPSYAGITVADTVKVKAEFSAVVGK